MTEATPISTEDSLRVIRHIATTNQVSLPWTELRQILETRLASILESKVLTEVIPSRVPATITTVNYEPTDPSSSPLSSPTFSFDDPSANVDDENELEKQHILTQIQHDLGEAAKQNDADENDDDEDDDDDDDDDDDEVAVEGEKKQDKEQQQQQEQQEVDKSTSHQQERISTEAHGTAGNKEDQESTSVAVSETSAAAPESQTMKADSKRDAKENEAGEKKVTDQENTESTPSSSATTQDQQHQDGSTVNIEAAAAAQAAESQPRLASRDLPAYETPAAYHKRICELLAAFSSPPFTIQRICELLLDPTAHHTLVTKYLRAVEKVLNITSSIDEFSNPYYIGVSALDAKEGEQAEFTLNGGYNTTMQSDDTSIETAMPTTTEATTSSSVTAAAAATGSPEESRTVPTMAQDNKMETSGETDNNANANAVPATTSMEQEGNMAMDVDPPADGSAANGAPVRSPIEGSDSENATTMMDVDP
ncbi:hypothetical protein BGW41_006974 [Actinomortierella wolfii]|nr:hypothetical protein BGW41_006974 [Actinomortierella wolfii]